MFYQLFYLLKDLLPDQIKIALSKNDLHSLLDSSDIKKFPEFNSNNFVNICNFVDYYQLIDDHEFLENIRAEIFMKNKKVIKNINQLSASMRQKIYDHKCISGMQCNYANNFNHHIEHISCYKFLNKKFNISYDIDQASMCGGLELVKYLFKIGKRCTTRAMDMASACGHFDIVKYLYEIKKCDCTTNAIDLASQSGYLNIVKYLFEVAHKDCTTKAIDYASTNNHLDVVNYLFEDQHKDCTEDAIDFASVYGHLEVVIYLIEVRNKKYTIFAKQTTKKNVLEYLLTKRNFMI